MTSLRVMTFNLRNQTEKDGPNNWPHRRDAVVQLIKSRLPDVLGVQEARPKQADYLIESLPEYEMLGEYRQGMMPGEFSLSRLLCRRDSVVVETAGIFWLSETPHIPASKSWESANVRTACWVRIARPESDKQMFIVNTHLDHRSQPARENGAALIMDFIDRKASELPVIVMGDMNARPDNPAIQTFLNPANRVLLQDTLAVHLRLDPNTAGPGTFHHFTGVATPGNRIDYIMASPSLKLLAAEVVEDKPAGTIVSDHFPIQADFEWPAGAY